jgi:hypothetical protein
MDETKQGDRGVHGAEEAGREEVQRSAPREVNFRPDERQKLQLKIERYRRFAMQSDDETKRLIEGLIADLERKLSD